MPYIRLPLVSLLLVCLNVFADDCTPGFSEVVRHGMPELPQSVVAADFDSDGLPDLAAMGNPSRTVSLLLNRGDRGFARGTDVRFAGEAATLRGPVDLDGDGADDDLAAIGPAAITSLLGAGDGTFQTVATRLTGDALGITAVAADLDADGRDDLAVYATRTSGSTIVRSLRIFLAKRDGTFAEGAAVALRDVLTALGSGDVNGDGKEDLLAGDPFGGQIFDGNGDGTFKAGRLLDPAAATVQRLAVADWDEDGRDDLFAAGWIYPSSKPGTRQRVQIGSTPFAVDVDGDGHLDLFSFAEIQRGKGDGTFTFDAWMKSAGPAPAGAAFADFDGDGRLDVATATAWRDVAIQYGLGTMNFAGAWRVPPPAPYRATVAGDVNGDGRDDLVVAAASLATVYLGQPDGSLTFKTNIGNGQTRAAALGDFNGDAKADLFLDGTGLATGNGDGTFAAPSTLAGASNPSAAIAADLDGDGILDLVSGGGREDGSGLGEIAFLLNAGNGTFTRTSVTTAAVHSLAAADFNGDGRDDVVAGTGTIDQPGELHLFDGASLQTPLRIATGTQAEHVAAGDVDGDGHADVVTLSQPVDDLLIYGGNGNGTFRAPRRVNVPDGTNGGVTLGDFSGDGRLDIAVSTAELWEVLLFVQQPGGSFVESAQLPSHWYGELAADIDGDGRLDLVLDNPFGTGSVVAARNQCTTTLPVRLSSSGASAEGSAVPLVAEVAASGLVQLFAHDPSAGNGQPKLLATAELHGGRATFTITLGRGTHELHAVYLGEGTATRARSATIEHTVAAGGRRRSARH